MTRDDSSRITTLAEAVTKAAVDFSQAERTLKAVRAQFDGELAQMVAKYEGGAGSSGSTASTQNQPAPISFLRAQG